MSTKAKVSTLRQNRATAFDAFKVLADKEVLTDDEKTQYPILRKKVKDFDEQIERAVEAQTLSGEGATPVDGQPATALNRAGNVQIVSEDPYVDDKVVIKRGWGGTARSLVLGAMTRMVARTSGSVFEARQIAATEYGEAHPVTRALVASVGASGGFIIPPDYVNEIIELLRPVAVVRAAQPRVLPMPRGTMTMPAQTSPATASYGTEVQKIASSQPGLGQVVASFKKLTALVPVSNDMMRYSDPATDAFVRDDLVKVVGLKQDLAFLTFDGTQAGPMGYLGFANRYAVNTGGTAGVFLTTGNSTAPTGGNWIASNETYTLTTVAQELGGLVNKLDTANVPDIRRVWFMHPRSWNYLNNVQNSLGVYVYRDELSKGTLLGYQFKKTTQIPINIHDASSTNNDCSFVILAEMEQSMILDSMSLELAVSREGNYVDGSGNTISAFQNDQTLIRAIAEHDFQMRHDAAVAVLYFVRWAPAIS